MTMQTTSLEMSRALQEAGFWRDKELASWWWMYVDECHPGREPVRLSVLIRGARYKDKQHVPAAMLDDLVPALGLDKPVGWTGKAILTVATHGLTCDSLARVWIDEHAKEKA